MKKIAIVQSNYIPWKGYFDLIAYVDEFIIFDDMQYTKRDWRNRNKIKTSSGLKWLSVPVKVKGKYYQSIRDTEIDGNMWRDEHWNTILHNYRKARYFDEIASILEPFYLEHSFDFLSQLNYEILKTLCEYLGITTLFKNSWEFDLVEGKTERLVSICEQAGANVYVSGPAAKAYMDCSMFEVKNIDVEWSDYTGYPPYPQLWGEFEHAVSIIDLLFNCGKNAPNYMKFVK